MSRAILVAVPADNSKPLAAVTRLQAMMDRWDRERPDHGTTIFPKADLEPQLYGANLFREPLDQATGGHGNKVRFWVAIGVRYKSGDRWCRTLHGYLLKFPRCQETIATSDTIELRPDEFRFAGMAQEYAN
jgi:hypothetical protein